MVEMLLVASCLETIDVWRMFILMYTVVTVWGCVWNVCCVTAVVKNSVFF